MLKIDSFFPIDFLAASVAMFAQLMLVSVVHIYSLYRTNPLTYMLAFCKVRNYLVQVTSMVYRWGLIAASFDRYVMSSAIPRLRCLASVHITRRVTGVIVLIWLVLPIYILVLYDLRSRSCGVFNNYAGSLFVTIFTFVNTFGIPLPLMIIFTLLIRRNLARKRLRRQILTNSQQTTNTKDRLQRKRDQQALRMLFAQIFVFVGVTTPWMAQSIYNLISSSIPNKSDDRIAIEGFINAVAGVCVYVFPTISFYTYTLTSSMFRHELLVMLRPIFCCKRSLNNNNRIEPMLTINRQQRIVTTE